ncbi:hypothetical protein ACLWBD_07680 [Bdellovibrio sp. HCB117]|uniref:hypothetical protein n=1 Tax=Bdellovibrio sp. HCB117 TaxID=3394359 RepID=UPI0039B4210A
MKHWIFPLVFGFAFTSHAELTNDQRVEKLQKGVEQGNVEWVREAFAGLKDPFKKARGLFGGDSGVFAEYSGEYFLDKTFIARPCKDEIALILLQNGAVMQTYELFKKASEGGCPKSIQYLIDTKDSALTAQGAMDFFKFYGKKVGQVIRDKEQGIVGAEDALDAWDPIQMSFEKFVMEKCPDRTKTSKECLARAAFDETASNVSARAEAAKKNMVKQEAEDKYLNSPEGIAAQICEIDARIAEAKAEVQRQRAVGKVAGAVSLAALHWAGEKIVDLTQARKTLESDFVKKTGKSPKCR